MLVNGDRDTDALADSQAMAEGFRPAGVDTEFYRVANSDHGGAWFHALPRIFDFFDRHKCR